MRLLIFTQKMDSADPVLGFFCGWVREISKHAESVHVICLEEGKYDLPNNVNIYSLGKEQGAGKFEYILHFWHHLFSIRGQYDKVFVHMNQEYVLLGGLFWKCSRVPVYMWRNHPRGNILTRIAVWFSKKVFCTSTESFTARFKKSVIMPAGIDTAIFRPLLDEVRKKHSVCMVGRISPIKRVDVALQAVKTLIDSGTQVSLSIIGSALPADISYFDELKKYVYENNLSSYVRFFDSVSQENLPAIYSSHEICLNLTEDGSFDKTIVESASCGAMPLVSNKSLEGVLPDPCITEISPQSIADSIQKILNTPARIETRRELEKFAESQSLSELVKKLVIELN